MGGNIFLAQDPGDVHVFSCKHHATTDSALNILHI